MPSISGVSAVMPNASVTFVQSLPNTDPCPCWNLLSVKRWDRTLVVTFAVVLATVMLVHPAKAQDAHAPPDAHDARAETGDAAIGPVSFDLGGLVEVSGSRHQPYGSGSARFTAAETLEFRVGIELPKWVRTEFIWAHGHEHEDEDAHGHAHGHAHDETETDLGDLIATFLAGPPEGFWRIRGGLGFLPFSQFTNAATQHVDDAAIGPFKSAAIVDPLSFEYGGKLEQSLQLEVSVGQFEGDIFGYYGADPRVSGNRTGYGAGIGYKHLLGHGSVLKVNLSFINDLGRLTHFKEVLFEGDTATDGARKRAGQKVDEQVPGWAAATQLLIGDLTVFGELITGWNRFDPAVLPYGARGARPSAWVLETGYAFELARRPGDIVLGYHGTSEAAGLDLPASRFVATLNFYLWNEQRIATIEWMRESDYGTAYDGTGSTSHTLTAQLGITFE